LRTYTDHPISKRGETMGLFGEQLCRCDLEARIKTYGVLADVFGGTAEEAAAGVVSLKGAGSWCSLAFYDEDAIQAACAEAERAARDPGEAARFCDERQAIIGAERFDPFVHRVSPCEAMYVTDRPEDLVGRLSALYEKSGYAVRHRVSCESHIAVELDYMRFLLERVRTGDSGASDQAANFFLTHLSGWSILFAVAFGDAASHPISRCAAITLDRFLSCEEHVIRSSVPANCIQCRLAGSS
jgi:TorA maturation chaperone TorD